MPVTAAQISRNMALTRSQKVVLASGAGAPSWLPEGVPGGALVVLALVYCLLGIALMLYLFRLRSAFQEEAPPLPPASGGGTGEI